MVLSVCISCPFLVLVITLFFIFYKIGLILVWLYGNGFKKQYILNYKFT